MQALFNLFLIMRSYNPKEWSRIILDFHKSDTLRKLIPVLAGMVVYAWIIAYAELHFISAARKEQLKKHFHRTYTPWLCNFFASRVSYKYCV